MHEAKGLELAARVLDYARDLLSKPNGWTQGTYARDANGDDQSHRKTSSDVTCFCSIGAIDVSTPRACRGEHVYYMHKSRAEAMSALRHAISPNSDIPIAVWNDALQRTQKEVVEAFDKAIIICRQELANVAV